MTILPRAATSPELAKLRSDNQSSRLYLTVHSPATIYTARLAAVPASTDSVVSITYNSGSGTHTNILADMTMLVGTSAGGYDVGIVRIRNTTGIGATSGTFNIGEESEINWPANAYLTVLDEFALWPKHPRLTSNIYYMDYDIAYSDQHSKCDPVPVMGPAYILWLRDSTVSVTPDGSQSWTINNSINGYSWTAPGASATSGLTTATPTITYNATGLYRIALTVSNTDGKSFTGYRTVFVLNPAPDQAANGAITRFKLESLDGNYSSGGWTARIFMEENADRSIIRDRALVILHTRDWWGSAESAVGYLAGCENILLVGYIDGESINWSPDGSPDSVVFNIQTFQAWLGHMSAFPAGLKNRTNAPDKWFKFQGLTARACTWHILHWRTTATRCMDVFPCANDWAAARLEAPGAQSILGQIDTILQSTLLAKSCCDRYSRLFMQIDQNLLDNTARGSVPTVMSIAKGDWTNDVTFDRRVINDVSYIDLNGVSISSNAATPIFSLAPGHVFGRLGAPEVHDRLVLFDQSQANTLAGLIFGWRNNPYPNFRIDLAMHQRLIDIAPYQYLSIAPSADDTPRGFAATIRIIPRAIRHEYRSGFFLTSLDVETETLAALSITGETPQEPPEPPIIPPPLPPEPPIIPPAPPLADAKKVWLAIMPGPGGTGGGVAWTGDYFQTLDNQPTWNFSISPPPDATDHDWFGISRNGLNVYWIVNVNKVYQCNNPEGVSPSWTLIAQAGSTLGGNTLDATPVFTPAVMCGDRLILACRRNTGAYDWLYAEYDGVNWFTTFAFQQNLFSLQLVALNTIGNQADNRVHFIDLEFPDDLNDAWTIGFEAWHRESGSINRYFSVRKPSTGHLYLHKYPGDADYDLGTSFNDGDTRGTKIHGAQNGPQVYAVVSASGGSGHGNIVLADDGVNFSVIANWRPAWIADAKYGGGGNLVLAALDPGGSSVPTRLYERDGTAHDKTGNYYTEIFTDIAAGKIIGMGLVY